MSDLTGLQEKITFLEKHVEEQDAEIYRQSSLIQSCIAKIEKLELRLSAFESSGSASGSMPADEKPPHY